MAENAVFETLDKIDVSDKIEQKNGLNYLSWAWAWKELLKVYPTATYKVYENKDGWNYHTDGKTCWVKCGVTVNGIEQVEMLPVMNYSNKSIPFNSVTSVDVTKAIQRCVTKAIARHGLGLYIYAGEDLPESATEVKQEEQPKKSYKTNDKETDHLIATVLDAMNHGKLKGDYLKRAQQILAKPTKEDLNKIVDYLLSLENVA